MDVARPGKPCCPLYTEGIHQIVQRTIEKAADFQDIIHIRNRAQLPFGDGLSGYVQFFRELFLR